MPWCGSCVRFYNPNTLRPDGTCPTCGRQVAEPKPGVAPPAPRPEGEKLRRFSDEPTPWHFKVLLVGVIGYLGWRLVQGIDWVAHHL